MTPPLKIYILDESVLLHDPTALFRFTDHDIHIPAAVVATLDDVAQNHSDTAGNAREVNRAIEALMLASPHGRIDAGIPLPSITHHGNFPAPTGKLFLTLPTATARTENPESAGDPVLGAALAIRATHPHARVTLVSKNVNRRIRARVAGLVAEDYYSDRIVEDADLLYSGVRAMAIPAALEQIPADPGEAPTAPRRHALPDAFPLVYPNEGIITPDGKLAYIARLDGNGEMQLEVPRDYTVADNAVWGITARNAEQNFALNLLMDANLDFVSLIGVAGSGKTLLALAAGLAQCMDTKRYREIIMTRETVSVGEDIGFLPGTEEEKMTPWMGALLDNLEVLSDSDMGGSWGRAATADVLNQKIKIRSLGFMRGRTFLDRYIIIDEAQNLSAKQMRTLITRAGPGTKIVCLGNIAQIDTPYLSETTSGLTYAVDRFREWRHSGHLTLVRSERSRLAEYATQKL